MKTELFALLTPAQQDELREKAYDKLVAQIDNATFVTGEINLTPSINKIVKEITSDIVGVSIPDQLYDIVLDRVTKDLKARMKG